MTYDRSERIRRAAILMASLDETLAQALLDELPTQEAETVLAELDRLEAIDPEERADVLDEFRRATRRTDDRGAVEFTYSAPMYMASATASGGAAGEPPVADADVAAMAELLGHEQPQIVAAALSRLSNELGAAVFAALPSAMHAEVLDRVSRLTLADEEAVQEVETQLQRKLDERRERRERAAAGAELARRLLAKTPPQEQAVLLARLSGQRPPVVHAPSAHRTASVSTPIGSRWSLRRKRAPAGSDFAQRADLQESPARVSPPPPAAPIQNQDPSLSLETLSDELLVAALRQVDDETGLRALAAASDQLFKRICRRLPRGQARKLRRLVRMFGPTSLAELQRAQQEVLRAAHQLQETDAAA
jgi:flagellar motor switch protein FliG